MGLFVGGSIALLVLLNLNFVASQRSDYCYINGTTWSKYNGFCYLFKSKSELRMSYYDAEDYCRSFGAHLTSIHSESENSFILRSMEDGRYGSRAWIGLNLLAGENSPRWSDGTIVSYQKRVKKEFPKKEKCFMMYSTENGWRPEHCALHYPPICKIRDRAIPTSVPPTILPYQVGYCPSGWIQFGQKCYNYFGFAEKDKLKYLEARNACWRLGKEYSLVSIHSMEEQAFLTQHLSDLGTSAWIGINKVESDEIGHDIVFGWVDNSRNDFSYWAKGHPPSGTWKYCGKLVYDGINKGEWAADYCEVKRRGYICQRPSDPYLPKPKPKPSGCQTGFQGFRNSCYRYMPLPQTQEIAEKSCQKLGGHLVSIVDGFEQAFLYSLLANKTKPIGIGLENIQGTRFVRWTDKQPLYYANWANEQPRFSSQKKSCVFMDYTNNFKWNMTDCSRSITYVCKTTTDIPPKVPEIVGTCPTGEPHVIDIGDKYCYHVPKVIGDRVQSWDAASRYCLSKGMTMVSLHSDHETYSLMAYLWNAFFVSLPIHLGLIRISDKKSFMWTDLSALNYTNWAEGEPSSWTSDKNCVAFSPTEGTWNPIHCTDLGVTLCRSNKITK